MLGNAWIYECLVQYRLVAARYLKDIANEFDDEVALQLLVASQIYQTMATQALTDKEHTFCSIAPYPFMLKEGEKWTPEMIEEQVRRIEPALYVERKAIAEIEKALALITHANNKPEKTRNDQ